MPQVNPNEIAANIMQQGDFITFKDNKETYKWNADTGIYEPCNTEIETKAHELLCEDAKTYYINETMNSIRRQTYINREDVAKDINLIPLEDCVYNFKTNETTPYSPNQIFLTKHPIKYHAPLIEEPNPIDTFLEQVTESQDDHLLIKEIIGYCYYRSMPFQNLFLFYGSGGNGKSVLLDIIKNLLGEENVSGQSLQNLTRNRFAPATLYNKNANIFGDLPRTALQDVGPLKELTGGDSFEAEKKFKDGFKFYNHAKIIASCNEVPETPDESDAWYRRIIIINFPNNFEENPDRQLSEKLCVPGNLSSFFKSCINAFKNALDDNQLIRQESIEEKRRKYRHFSNSALAFIVDRLELDPEMQIENGVLYNAYKDYCRERKIVAFNEDWFFRKLYKTHPNQLWKKREASDKKRTYFTVGVTFRED